MLQQNFLEPGNNLNSQDKLGLRSLIIGVGGAGISLVDGLRFDNFDFLQSLVIDVDVRTLSDSLAGEKLSFGRRHTRGMGTGGDMNLARRAIEEEKDKLREKLDGVDLVFLLAGLGGGTGGGVASVVARLARERGALVFAFVPLPFSWEKSRHAQAEECLEDLRKHANAVVPLPNDSLLQMGGADATALECFAEAGRNVSKGISAICKLIYQKGMIDVDFAHLRKAFSGRSGRTLFGYGKGIGKDGLREAMRELLVCPMLHLPEVSKAADILLIFINGGPNLGMSALNSASQEIREAFKAGEQVVFGAHVDENMGDDVQITVLGATNLGVNKPKADVAPPAKEVYSVTSKPKEHHPSRLSSAKKATRSKGKKKTSVPLEQNTFSFMDDKNQRGIFEDLPSRNLYEGEDLDVPTYLRRGVQITL
jgi:cell division protein FtsZ